VSASDTRNVAAVEGMVTVWLRLLSSVVETGWTLANPDRPARLESQIPLQQLVHTFWAHPAALLLKSEFVASGAPVSMTIVWLARPDPVSVGNDQDSVGSGFAVHVPGLGVGGLVTTTVELAVPQLSLG
jgi:hypothetical protein